MIGIKSSLGAGEELAYFEMSFCPSLELVSLVRRFVATFYLRVLSDADLASRVALAMHELLENAVKYSSDGETHIRLEIRSPGRAPTIEIRTRNRTPADMAAALSAKIARMNAIGDPFRFYQALMRERAGDDMRGGLGLGRIAAEAEMELSCRVDGDTVEVRAWTTTAQREAA
jgi:hypothetical protein